MGNLTWQEAPPPGFVMGQLPLPAGWFGFSLSAHSSPGAPAQREELPAPEAAGPSVSLFRGSGGVYVFFFSPLFPLRARLLQHCVNTLEYGNSCLSFKAEPAQN